jgi:hypothetical protein
MEGSPCAAHSQQREATQSWFVRHMKWLLCHDVQSSSPFLRIWVLGSEEMKALRVERLPQHPPPHRFPSPAARAPAGSANLSAGCARHDHICLIHSLWIASWPARGQSVELAPRVSVGDNFIDQQPNGEMQPRIM